MLFQFGESDEDMDVTDNDQIWETLQVPSITFIVFQLKNTCLILNPTFPSTLFCPQLLFISWLLIEFSPKLVISVFCLISQVSLNSLLKLSHIQEPSVEEPVCSDVMSPEPPSTVSSMWSPGCSSIPSSQVTDEGNATRSAMDDFLSTAGYSPVKKTLTVQWNEASIRTQKDYMRKANQVGIPRNSN